MSDINAAMSKLTHGVYIITTKAKDKINGMTAAWVSKVSFDPPLVMVAVGLGRYSHELMKEGKVFAVNILDERQIDIGKHFGTKSGRKVDKFKGIEYETRVTGSPILKDAIAYIDCKLVSTYPAGDHTLFIGEVVDADVLREGEPQVFKHEDYFGRR
ncbi:MAG: flavin reductase [Deltaproteobacteria bacterium GWC2_42_11]|nr:MAG: flavin reductase [Deltaproteobacteria bacterium GWC2_42_11]HBO84703.1 flavin reductase [Deltaproteobacteria bacterium]